MTADSRENEPSDTDDPIDAIDPGGPIGALGMLLWLIGLILGFVAVVEYDGDIATFVGPGVMMLLGALLTARDPAILYPHRWKTPSR